MEGELAEYFAHNGTWLRISLDAWDDASYTASRGVRDGEFKRTLKRISDFELFDAYHELETKFDKDYEWCPFLQALCVIGADLNVYSCQDKAYTDKGLLGSLKELGFAELWNGSKSIFYKINPSKDCRHHCVANQKNQILHEYLNTDPVHKVFV